MDFSAVGDIRIVAGILDNKTGAAPVGQGLAVELETCRNTGRQHDLDRVDKPLFTQHQRSPPGSRSGAGASGVTVAQTALQSGAFLLKRKDEERIHNRCRHIRTTFPAAVGDEGNAVFCCHSDQLFLALGSTDETYRQADDEVGAEPLLFHLAEQLEQRSRRIADDENAVCAACNGFCHGSDGTGDARLPGLCSNIDIGHMAGDATAAARAMFVSVMTPFPEAKAA